MTAGLNLPSNFLKSWMCPCWTRSLGTEFISVGRSIFRYQQTSPTKISAQLLLIPCLAHHIHITQFVQEQSRSKWTARLSSQSSFIALKRPKALENCNITHVLSVVKWEFDSPSPQDQGYKHLHIPVDDSEDVNLIEWFPESNAFIERGLSHVQQNEPELNAIENRSHHPGPESGVLVHW
jgi:hypothetical protein